MAQQETTIASTTQNPHYFGTITGRVKFGKDGMQITCTSDQTVLPLSITGAALLPPLPGEELIWHVLPRTDSNGVISGFKTWKYEIGMVSNDRELEAWNFTGAIYQVSSRKQLIAIEVLIQEPKPQTLRVTLKTPAIAQFEVGQQWKIRAVRSGQFLTIAAAHCLSPVVKVLSAADLAGNPSVEQSQPPATPTAIPLAHGNVIDDPIFQSVRAALQQLSPREDWSLEPPVTREDGHGKFLFGNAMPQIPVAIAQESNSAKSTIALPFTLFPLQKARKLWIVSVSLPWVQLVRSVLPAFAFSSVPMKWCWMQALVPKVTILCPRLNF